MIKGFGPRLIWSSLQFGEGLTVEIHCLRLPKAGKSWALQQAPVILALKRLRKDNEMKAKLGHTGCIDKTQDKQVLCLDYRH